MRGKQSVRKDIWHIGGKYKRALKRKTKQKGGAIPFGLLASIAASVLGKIAKPLLEKILGRGLKNGKKTYNFKKKIKSSSSKSTRR